MRRASRRHALCAALLLFTLTSCNPGPPGLDEPARFVGRETCRPCHESADQFFDGSDHDWAMDVANPETVLGDFDSASFTQHGITSRFYTRGDDYFVYTEDAKGAMTEFKVTYTFGFYPLQQYLVEFPGERYQCLPLCWDTRPAEEGGQRWFHVYDTERIAPDDELYWTRISQNWNYMCAECHSTDLRKAYDAERRTYHTTWQEIDVSCEACHGPGSRHVAWAEAAARGDTIDVPHYALEIELQRRDQVEWNFVDTAVIAQRTEPNPNDPQVVMCARCHSRRSTIREEYVYDRPLLDTHYPSLLREALYFPDGQILEEVYVYGSFLQSKMYRAGVVCTDCHDAHSGDVYIRGNGLCQRCHKAETYATREHHFHDPDSTGGQCIPCHMPVRHYMVVDPRLDHSMRIPRPDLTLRFGTPNACNECHRDRSVQWAADHLRAWYGPQESDGYGPAFASARAGDPRSIDPLIRLATDTARGTIIRATAVNLLGDFDNPKAQYTARTALGAADPMLRAAAVEAVWNQSLRLRIESLLPLIRDSIRLVRALAARGLADAREGDLQAERIAQRDTTIEEFREIQMVNADHPTSWVNLGNLEMELGRPAEAEKDFRTAIELDETFIPAYVNLADLYRSQNLDADGRQVLEDALGVDSEAPAVHHALGLLHVRNGHHDSALIHLERAVHFAPESPRYAYVYAVGVHSQGRTEDALEILMSGLARHPYDRDILYTLVTLLLEKDQDDQALEYLDTLQELYPDDERYQRLEYEIRQLRGARG